MSFDDYVGRSQTATDEVSPRLLAGLAATLGVETPAIVPPLWHWMLFQDWVPPDRIGPDGHPKRGGFLPPVHDLPRRMWAGGRVRWHATLREGDRVSRISTIQRVQEKQGGAGRLVFVTVKHVIDGPSGLAIEEEQDLVYRGNEGAAVKPADAVTDRLGPGEGIGASVRPDPVLLFRYSALTGNGHRIHYDLDYVRDVEGYPGLIVHGPLQATWLAGLVGEHPLSAFEFRGQRPAFHDRTLALEARPGRDGAALRSLDEAGAVCMQAKAVFA
jgi:hydroxyacyl-ACP dehydratase HTD2-like protein with hotdog domain